MKSTFLCTYGNPEFRGQYTFKLEPSGQVELEVRQGKDAQKFEKQLSKEDLTIWNERITDAEVCKHQRTRSGVPGEDIYVFELGNGDNHCTGEIWTNDRNDDPALDILLKAIESTADAMSQ